jgi:hypothetical protein
MYKTHNSAKAIQELAYHDLTPGKLGELFCRGAKTILIVDDSRVGWLWQELVGRDAETAANVGSTLKLWETNIRNIARNHRSGDILAGDMLRFVPGLYAHLARKIILFPEADGKEFRTVPEYFWVDNQPMMFPKATFHVAYELISDIITSIFPAAYNSPWQSDTCVAIEILKYLNTPEDADQMSTLLADAGSRWTLMGHRLDTHKAMAVGAFNTRFVRDLFAFASLIPGVRRWLHMMNRLARSYESKNVPETFRVIGKPHVDSGKIFTALVSDREELKTEVYDGNRWLELPLTPRSIAIFPSPALSKECGIAPTAHRILQRTAKRCRDNLHKPNITLIFAAAKM